MSQDSAVSFETNTRAHIGLAVHNLEASIRFYRTLLGQLPTKTRPGYAKFEVAEPPLNLSLNQVVGPTAPPHSVSHFGIQVKSSDSVRVLSQLLTEAGYETRIEEQVSCCYAVQNKVWVSDPDGNPWEVFVVLDNAGTQHASSAGGCCADLGAVSAGHSEFAKAPAESSPVATACSCG